ncbi:MAG: hypothetical protein Q8881_02405 [Sweet potato little leaf phytoplasma]|nr:hypothetical protein [Sweet potato little leaf phytoplasma]
MFPTKRPNSRRISHWGQSLRNGRTSAEFRTRRRFPRNGRIFAQFRIRGRFPRNG